MNYHMKIPGLEDVIIEKMEEIEERTAYSYQGFEHMRAKVLLNLTFKDIGNHLLR